MVVEEGQISLTEYIVCALRDAGGKHVFMVPGGYVDNFVKAIVSSEGIDTVVAASEAGAAMMADGYARVTGQIGVCLAISGPGASNMITGLSLSKSDRIPVVAITGDNPLAWRDRGSIQDAGDQGLASISQLALATDKQFQFAVADVAPDYLRKSFAHLRSSDPGPVNLSVPMDVQGKTLDASVSIPRGQIRHAVVDIEGLDQVASSLGRHARVAMLIGSGVRSSSASKSLVAFAERFGIPVATTMGAKGDFPEDHSLSMGVFGWAGSMVANETLMSDELDCLLVVGSKLGQIATMCWDKRLAENRTLIQIDVNAAHLNLSYSADLALVSDAGEVFKYLSTCEQADVVCADAVEQRREWWARICVERPFHYVPAHELRHCAPLHPGYAVARLCDAMPEDTRVFVDNGAHTFFAAHYWQTRHMNHFSTAIKYSGAMGWAISASIGAKLAQPEKMTLAIVGDGCMLMQGVEIQTAARYGMKGLIIVVLNNKAHGNPKLRLGDVSIEEHEATDIPDHDWAKFAESLGAKGMTVNSGDKLELVFAEARQQSAPVVIDVKCGLYPTPTKMFDESFMKEFNRYLD